ncbi:MAG: hypothetical protein LBR93_01020 [Treponema sp.]|jgi:hypothetical protein|nr:hypothetical protein [Treponema sp.]
MKIPPFFPLFFLLLLSGSFWLAAQQSRPAGSSSDTDLLDRDIDSLFGDPEPEAGPGEAAGGGDAKIAGKEEGETGDASFTGSLLKDLVRRSGFALEGSFRFYSGFAPGWSETPWNWDEGEEEFTRPVLGGMSADLILDFQISDVFRVRNSFGFSYPALALAVNEFFFDYNVKNRLFLRAGKFTPSWGRSSSYPFADLLSRVPPGDKAWGDPYVFKVNLPIGVGGIELISLTRRGFMASDTPTPAELGYGAKYNLALPWVDIDLGAFYLEAMPFRVIASAKTTLPWDIEAYTEGLVAAPHETREDLSLSANLGLARDFLGELFTLNGELFYNGEEEARWFSPKTDLREAKAIPLIKGFNAAFNLVIRPRLFWDFRIFSQLLYGIKEDTVQFVPGFSCKPLSHLELSLAVPMALGSRDGTYYRDNVDTRNRPFAVVLLVSLQGSQRFDYYR